MWVDRYEIEVDVDEMWVYKYELKVDVYEI